MIAKRMIPTSVCRATDAFSIPTRWIGIRSSILLVAFLAILTQIAFALAPVPITLKSEGYYDGTDFQLHRVVAPGVDHQFDSLSTGPMTLNTVTLDFGRSDLVLETEKAKDDMTAGEPVDEMTKRLADPKARPIVVMNADFWGDRRIPIGLFVDEGTIWKDPYNQRSVFAFDDQGHFSIGPARFHVALHGSKKDQVLEINRINFPEDLEQIVVYTWPLGETAPPPQTGQSQVVLKLQKPEWLPNVPTSAVVESIKVEGAAPTSLDPNTVAIVLPGNPPEWIAKDAAVSLQAIFEDLPGKVIGVVGGGPQLVENGEIRVIEAGPREEIRDSFIQNRHPRTAVGIKPDGKTLVFCVVDGRQPGRSIGIDLIDLAAWMKEQGCITAMNLDGGGSSSLVIRDEVINFPSDAEGPRAVSNALVVRRTAPVGPLDHLDILPRKALLPPKTKLTLQVRGFDAANEPLDLDTWTVRWEVTGGDATIAPDGTLDTGETTEDLSVRAVAIPRNADTMKTAAATPPSGKAALSIKDPAKLEAIPEAALFGSGEECNIRFNAYTADGTPFLSDPAMWEISVPPFLRFIPSDRVVKAINAGEGFITGKLGEKSIRVPVSADRFKETIAYAFDTLPADDMTTWMDAIRHKPDGTAIVLDTEKKKEGAASWKFTYGMEGGGVTKIALPISTTLPGAPLAVGFWVYGDGQEQWLRGELRDANDNGYYLDFTDATAGINWKDEWRFVRASLVNPTPMGGHKAALTPPYTVKSIYVAQAREASKRDGEIHIDALYALDLPDSLKAK